MLFLASDIADTPPDLFKWIMIVLAWLLSIAGTILSMNRKGHKIPQPIITSSAPEFASASGVKNLADRLAKLDNEVGEFKSDIETRLTEMQSAISHDGENRAVRINERMDTLVLAIGELRGSEKAHSGLMDHLVNGILQRRSHSKSS